MVTAIGTIPSNWLNVAKTLQTGRTARLYCPFCNGNSKALSVGTSDRYWWCYCFRCGVKESVPKTALNTQERRELQESTAKWLSNKYISLPNDATDQIPLKFRLWLYKASIHDFKRYNFQYSPSIDRVIIPIMQDGVLQGLLSRSVDSKPKYILRKSSSSLHYLVNADTSTVVLCEDILSAIRIGKYSTAIALIGTHAQDITYKYCLGKDVILWLDPDRAGQNASTKIAKHLTVLGVKHKTILSKRDPKLHTNAEIQEYLYGCIF